MLGLVSGIASAIFVITNTIITTVKLSSDSRHDMSSCKTQRARLGKGNTVNVIDGLVCLHFCPHLCILISKPKLPSIPISEDTELDLGI